MSSATAVVGPATPPLARVEPAAGHQPRRSDLDWVRVLAVLLLVPLHVGNMFNLDPVIVAYVKDTQQIDFLVALKDFLSRWRLETLFFVSGAVSWYVLGRRSGAQYLRERTRRLLVPFAFSLIVLIPLTVNARWIGQPGGPSLQEVYGRFFGSPPTDLTGMDGHFTPSHLWFVLYLFLFSLLGLPVLRLLRRPLPQRVLAALFDSPGAIYLFVLPLTLGRLANLFGLGDKDPLYYFLVFAFGYAAVGQPRFQETVDRYLPLSVTLALAATLAGPLLLRGPLEPWSAAWFANLVVFRVSQWTWVLAVLGAGHRWLGHDGRVLRYANEAVYPFYILHLPLATLVGWWVIGLDLAAGDKYALIVLATLLLTVAAYDLLIKRVPVLRVCFGLKGPSGTHVRRVVMQGNEAPSALWSA